MTTALNFSKSIHPIHLCCSPSSWSICAYPGKKVCLQQKGYPAEPTTSQWMESGLYGLPTLAWLIDSVQFHTAPLSEQTGHRSQPRGSRVTGAASAVTNSHKQVLVSLHASLEESNSLYYSQALLNLVVSMHHSHRVHPTSSSSLCSWDTANPSTISQLPPHSPPFHFSHF